jgi:cysteine sulfinate desulfinase/cysteine desulfurase-like protein
MGKMIYLDNAATTKTAPEGYAAVFYRVLWKCFNRL